MEERRREEEEEAGGGSARECPTKNKNPTQRCGEKSLPVLFQLSGLLKLLLELSSAQIRDRGCTKLLGSSKFTDLTVHSRISEEDHASPERLGRETNLQREEGAA